MLIEIPGGCTPRNSWWGCAARFSKSPFFSSWIFLPRSTIWMPGTGNRLPYRRQRASPHVFSPLTPAVRLSQSSLIHLRRSVQFLCVLVCPLSCYGHIFQRFLIINVVGDWVWILTCDNLPILVERCTLSFSDDHYTLWGWVGSRAFVFSLRCKTYESSSHF